MVTRRAGISFRALGEDDLAEAKLRERATAKKLPAAPFDRSRSFAGWAPREPHRLPQAAGGAESDYVSGDAAIVPFAPLPSSWAAHVPTPFCRLISSRPRPAEA